MGAACCRKSVAENERLMTEKLKEMSEEEKTEVISPSRSTKGYISLMNNFKNPKKEKKAICGIGGFENLGKTCYINAILQCLCNTNPLADYFLSGLFKEEICFQNRDNSSAELIYAFAEIITTQWKANYDCIVPKHFVEIVQKNTQFAQEEEHDVHEFLTFFMGKMNELLNRASTNASTPVPEYIGNTDEHQAAQAWHDHLKSTSSVIVDLFHGQLKSTIKCSQCDQVSQSFEPFMSISLPISVVKDTSLKQCLKDFTKNESLEQSWFCSKCNKQVTATKSFSIWKVPPILIFHLKRFHFTPEIQEKIKTDIGFPLKSLDLTEYVAGPQKTPPKYDLYAVVNHTGKLTEGHYFTYSKNKNDQRWYKFDDDMVEELSEDAVESNKAYLLFYYNSTPKEFFRQSRTLPQFWPHVLNNEFSPPPPAILKKTQTLNINSIVDKQNKRRNSEDIMECLNPPSFSFSGVSSGRWSGDDKTGNEGEILFKKLLK